MKKSDPDVEQISTGLLSYLGTELGATELTYSSPLTHILGGYDAFTYQFCLDGTGPSWGKRGSNRHEHYCCG